MRCNSTLEKSDLFLNEGCPCPSSLGFERQNAPESAQGSVIMPILSRRDAKRSYCVILHCRVECSCDLGDVSGASWQQHWEGNAKGPSPQSFAATVAMLRRKTRCAVIQLLSSQSHALFLNEGCPCPRSLGFERQNAPESAQGSAIMLILSRRDANRSYCVILRFRVKCSCDLGDVSGACWHKHLGGRANVPCARVRNCNAACPQSGSSRSNAS